MYNSIFFAAVCVWFECVYLSLALDYSSLCIVGICLLLSVYGVILSVYIYLAITAVCWQSGNSLDIIKTQHFLLEWRKNGSTLLYSPIVNQAY